MRISIGKSRKDTHWKVVDYSWEELVAKLKNTTRTKETTAEYRRMPKDDKSNIKDVGGFVGGVVMDGRRTKNNIASRSLITLDADFASGHEWEDIELFFDYKICCYSTHSHTRTAPRLRYVIPLDREVSPEEYEPIARMVASDLGIEQFDITTYETSRLMYWPSTSRDGEFEFHEMDGETLAADEILARYDDWRDTTEWPLGSTEASVRTKQAKAQGDPTQKNGVIGLFCRAYNIHEAIETFLPDLYEPCAVGGRYTYTGGTTSAGVVTYDDLFAYSHHSTDPAGGVLCNAFDLVRLHKFADLDESVAQGTEVTKLPSYKAMTALVVEDSKVKQLAVAENIEGAKAAFSAEPEEEDVTLDWTAKLKLNKQGAIETTTDNLVIILENDPNLKGKLAVNTFKGIPCIRDNVLWRKCTDHSNGEQWDDDDSSALTHYIETTYGIYNRGKMSDALSIVMNRHAFHPVKDYLEGLEWDGIKRAEKLFINFLGADDNLYTRTVTRKWLTAAVARVMVPGIKFDNLIVLVGAQGIGKSFMGHMLGRGWFSDTFGTVQGKDAYEQLKGCWIIEIAELSAMKKAEVESVKMFISKQEDNYRGAYREFAKVNKRQCVFYGTTNDDSFLRDRTGNRRFWPIGVNKDAAMYEVFELTDADVDQVWAEAVQWWKSGESLYLDREVTALAVAEQDKYMTLDPRQGMIEEYLDKEIPENWLELNKTQRRNYIQGYLTVGADTPMIRREYISVVELAYELFGEEVLQPWQAKEYHGILTGIRGWAKKGKRVRDVYGQQPVYERTE